MATLIDRVEERRRVATGDIDLDALIVQEADLRDRLQRAENRLFCSEHPAYVNWEVDPDAWDARWKVMQGWIHEHEKVLQLLIRNGVDRPEWHCERCGRLPISYNGCSCTLSYEALKLRNLIEKQGAALLEVPWLDGQRVLIVKEAGTRTPRGNRRSVSFSLAELAILWKQGSFEERVRAVYEVKKEMQGGRVVK